jgi:DNA invertase Pin-like site-specific DNA recombinase
VHVIAYIRVSTEMQVESGLGLEAQQARINEEATRRGWQLTWAVDEGLSGSDRNRPALTHALDQLQRGKADGLVVVRLDRLARSVVQASDIISAATKQKWSLIVLDLCIDIGTPEGRAMAHMLAVFAEYERELISRRTKEALAAAKARGTRLGRPRQTPDDVVHQIVSLHQSGLSLRGIARTLTAQHVPTTRGAEAWRPSSVRRVLNSHRLDLESVASQRGGSR